MATTNDITTLEELAAKNAALLAKSPSGKLGYISNIFTDEGKLKELAEVAATKVDNTTFTSHVSDFASAKSSLEDAISALQSTQQLLQSLVDETKKIAEQAQATALEAKSTADETVIDVTELTENDQTQDSKILELENTTAEHELKINEFDAEVQSTLQKLEESAKELETIGAQINNKVDSGDLEGAISTLKSELEGKIDLSNAIASAAGDKALEVEKTVNLNKAVAEAAADKALENEALIKVINTSLDEKINSADVDSKISTAIQELNLEESLATKADKTEIANFMKPGQVNKAIDDKLEEFAGEGKWNLQSLEWAKDYIGEKLYGKWEPIYEAWGSTKFEGTTITAAIADLQKRLKAVEQQQTEQAAAVANYTAVVKDFITPTEQS